MRIQNYINGIEGVTAGGTSTVNVPINRRYHWLKAFVSGNNGSATTNPVDLLDYVRLIVNGVVMRDLSPAHIINIAKLNGVTPAAGETEVDRVTLVGGLTLEDIHLLSWVVANSAAALYGVTRLAFYILDRFKGRTSEIK